jgi:uncharacterized repeat protein (TIGR01451 family)
LTITNYGPSGATNIVVTDTLPVGGSLFATNASQGTVTTNGARLLTWAVPSLAKDAYATLAIVVRASAIGRITNAATVTTGTTDLNPDDDSASAVAVVVSPSADLALSLVGAPNPVLMGNNLTYTITISNGGPATATGVALVDKLPPEATFVSAAPAGYTVAGQTITFTNLGNLDSGLWTTATIVVQATAAGTITDTASCSSGITDPFKANNSASVKTIVQPVAGAVELSITLSGTNVIVAWPITPLNYYLESATSLRPPMVWTPVTNPLPIVVGERNTVTMPIGSSNMFFRLHGTP